MPDATIRPLGRAELDDFIRLRMGAVQESPFAFGASPDIQINRRQTRKDLAAQNEENFILGYWSGDDPVPVGMVGFIRETSRKQRHKGWIWGMYVEPDGRGKGIGKALMVECIKRARELPGLERITLSVTDQSPTAEQLYLSLGFEEYAREPDALRWKGVSMAEVFLALEL
jgi:ribosomal protein S18 acetylase RimI-like enzyme